MNNVLPYIAPRGGLRYDLPADLISDLEMSDCRNVYFQDGLVKKRYGYTKFGNNLPLPGPVIGSDQFYLFSGSDYLLAITTKLAFRLASPGSDAYWETINSSEVEDDCETTWTNDMGANGSVSDETTIKKVGTKSQKISPLDGFTTGLMAHHDLSLGDKSDYRFVRLWVRSSVDLDAGAIQFLIDDSSGCGSPTETLDFPALSADTWKLVFLEADDPSSNMASIASIGIKAATDFGAANIYIDDIQFVKSFSTNVAYDSSQEDFASFDYVRKSTETDPWWILTNGVDEIQKWTGTGALSNLISSYPSGVTSLLAKQVLEFKDYLLLLDVTENGDRYPQRIRWSDTATPDDFVSGNASYIDLPGADWISGAIKFKGNYIAVLKERSIWLGYATGDTDVFQFDRKTMGTGCAAPKTIENLEDEVIFLGWDDVYIFNGIDVESAGANIRRELFDTLNSEQIGKSFGVVIEEQNEYWLFTPSTSSDYCDTVWCYNYDLNKWSRHNLNDTMSSYGYYEKQAQLTIGDLQGTIGQQTWRIGDRATLSAAPTTLFADISGYIYEYDTLTNDDDGNAIDGWFSTKDFNPTQLMQRFRITRIDVYYTGNGLDVAYSTDKGLSWTPIGTLDANSNLEEPQRLFLKLDCLLCRLRFRNSNSGEHFEFNRASIYWEPSGRRL